MNKQQLEQIAVSLFIKPATLEELMKRDFLANIADFNVDRALAHLEQNGWIYRRGQKFFTYTDVARNELAEYELV
jgi:hypothetical protein